MNKKIVQLTYNDSQVIRKSMPLNLTLIKLID